ARAAPGLAVRRLRVPARLEAGAARRASRRARRRGARDRLGGRRLRPSRGQDLGRARLRGAGAEGGRRPAEDRGRRGRAAAGGGPARAAFFSGDRATVFAGAAKKPVEILHRPSRYAPRTMEDPALAKVLSEFDVLCPVRDLVFRFAADGLAKP